MCFENISCLGHHLPTPHSYTDATRRRAFALVSQAYTSIVAEDFAAFVGLPVEEAVKGTRPARSCRGSGCVSYRSPAPYQQPLEHGMVLEFTSCVFFGKVTCHTGGAALSRPWSASTLSPSTAVACSQHSAWLSVGSCEDRL